MVDVPGSDWAMHRDMHSWHSWHSWCTTSVGLRGIICNTFALWGLELKMYTQTNIRDSKSMTRNWREMVCGRTCYGQYYNIFSHFFVVFVLFVLFVFAVFAWLGSSSYSGGWECEVMVKYALSMPQSWQITPIHRSMWFLWFQISPPLFFVWIL